MRHSLILVLVLSGCAAAERINPLNWFGPSIEEQAVSGSLIPEGAGELADTRQLVAEVTQMRVNRTPDGAIVEAYGTAPGAGAWDPDLVPLEPEGGTLTLEFRVRPIQGTAAGAAPTLLAGAFLSNRDLAGVATIRVAGASNARTAQR